VEEVACKLDPPIISMKEDSSKGRRVMLKKHIVILKKI